LKLFTTESRLAQQLAEHLRQSFQGVHCKLDVTDGELLGEPEFEGVIDGELEEVFNVELLGELEEELDKKLLGDLEEELEGELE